MTPFGFQSLKFAARPKTGPEAFELDASAVKVLKGIFFFISITRWKGEHAVLQNS